MNFDDLTFDDAYELAHNNEISLKRRKIDTNNKNELYNFVIASRTAFNSHGAPETPYKNMTNRELIKVFLNDNFTQLEDNELKNYFQEMHNRIAKKLKIPAVEVSLKELNKHTQIQAIDEQAGSFLYMIPIELFYDVNCSTPNMKILISKYRDESSPFKARPTGIEYLISLFHETKHLQQTYVASKLFANQSQLINDDYINSIAFMQTIIYTVNILYKNATLLYPKIQSQTDKETIDTLASYWLLPHEIDARKYSFSQMELLAKNGLLCDTNWQKYKYHFYLEEYSLLNELKKSASDICPAVHYNQRLCNKLMQQLRDTDKLIFEKFSNVFKKFNVNVYYENIQKYYEELKQHLKLTTIDVQKNLISMDSKFEYFNKTAVQNMSSGYAEMLLDNALHGVILNIFDETKSTKIYLDKKEYDKTKYNENLNKRLLRKSHSKNVKPSLDNQNDFQL